MILDPNQPPSALLVLLYNCQVKESQTLNSLLETKSNFSDCSLTIWNNGPDIIQADLDKFNIRFGHVDLTQTINNRSLSQIYNTFLRKRTSRFIIIDHDTSLTDEFLSNALSLKCGEIGIPSILSRGKMASPHVNGSYNTGPYENKETLTAIGSGITLTQGALDLIAKKYNTPFDENFVFYGVDSTFFFRLQKLELTSIVKPLGPLEHSISMYEHESPKASSFRKLERSYDLGLSLRYYPTAKLFAYIFKTIIRSFFADSLIYPTTILKAVLTGKHYRKPD